MAGPAIPSRVPLIPPQFRWVEPTGLPVEALARYMAYVDAVLQALIGLISNFGGGLVADTSAAGHTLLASNLLAGVLSRSGPVGAFNDTTPTAALIVAAIPRAVIGSNRLIFVGNAGGGLMTILAGVGVTLSGTMTIAAGSGRWFLVTVANATLGAEAVTLSGLSVGTI